MELKHSNIISWGCMFPNEINSRLTEIDLSNNNIGKMDAYYGGIINVKKLTLDSCGLQRLPMGLLKSLPKLEYLSLARNKVEKMDTHHCLTW